MSLQLDLQSDFATILDGGEPVTLARRDSAATIAIAGAWRFSGRTSEPEPPAGGHVAQSDVAWQFPWDEANEPPRLGDAIRDAAGECFTILSIETLGAKTRLRCATRNLRLACQLNDRVDVEAAVWEDTGGGPEIVGWTTVRPAIAARIQPASLTIDHTTTPPTATATFRILLGEQLTLNENSRFVDPQGNVYQLIELSQAERIDALPEALVVRVAE
jgi:hypothetical protein